MKDIRYLPYKVARKAYLSVFQGPEYQPDDQTLDNPDSVSDLIRGMIEQGAPCMISRFGSTELSCVCNYLAITGRTGSLLSYIKGQSSAWWWQESIKAQMQAWSGFFPSNESALTEFCKLTLQDAQEVDLLGSWLQQESHIQTLNKSLIKTRLLFLDPFWAKTPWTSALEGKKVIIVHPFKQTIEAQYKKRKLLHREGVLPPFDLKVIQAVQSLGGESEYTSWFDALNAMKEQLDNTDFDIALIGCGAYGMPLAAHVKRMGKIGIHIGGSLQLLFGICGKRWENPEYGAELRSLHPQIIYSDLANKDWVRPMRAETPTTSTKVEDSCYW
ncbi:hypothetical protein QEH59_15990 [Coraliomargarita sp. SDUM461004]|uniref:GT-D fold-like domain-containing protein n=1 Tax=Thalassobacterium sedimentorum TaxID=3041258 RepID=A0ABU1AQ99_9BACT|nr:hypothetical protein [Coraliomargarita sp. SDUM461004]MDQ8195936.1 hypothetical protein [Coraliomargarita sp. SDUM461004]